MMVKPSMGKRPLSLYEETSVPTVQEAVTLTKASQGIFAREGLTLQKIMSNKREVLKAFPIEESVLSVKESDLKVNPLPLERALGVIWCVENDSFLFRIECTIVPLHAGAFFLQLASFMIPVIT